MNDYLSAARYIDSSDPAVQAFSQRNASGRSAREKAISLYYAVRDQIRYNPFLDFSDAEVFRASAVLKAGEGFCVGKASLLASRWRAAFAGDIPMPGRNHFSVMDGLADPKSALFAGARRLMKLDQ